MLNTHLAFIRGSSKTKDKNIQVLVSQTIFLGEIVNNRIKAYTYFNLIQN